VIFPLRQERTTKEYAIIFSGRSIVSSVVAPDRSTGSFAILPATKSKLG
jgi:hypothetical protein